MICRERERWTSKFEVEDVDVGAIADVDGDGDGDDMLDCDEERIGDVAGAVEEVEVPVEEWSSAREASSDA